MTIKFGTKAKTLQLLEKKVVNAKILPQVCFSVADWKASGKSIDVIQDKYEWFARPVIVRSSSIKEDSTYSSLAGHYQSVADVFGKRQIDEAISTVIQSFGNINDKDQVFIQPMLNEVSISGVVFSRDPSNSSNYYVVNYDDVSGRTDTVTSGSSNDLKVLYHSKSAKPPKKEWVRDLIILMQELEILFNNDAIDIEFCLDNSGQLFLLQVRPLVLSQKQILNSEEEFKILKEIERKYITLSKPHPYLLGKKSIFGVMPDWNPAEIIGIRPKPLALSLYKELITDGTWAYQRDNYGYRNLRSFPLIISFAGFPYIDVRVSFNSFIPANLNEGLANRLVDYYLNQLSFEFLLV